MKKKKFKHFLNPDFVTSDDRTEYMWYGNNGQSYYWYNEFRGNRP